MKFSKKSICSNAKTELLLPKNKSNGMSSFKRSKSFRASVKLISKIRNHRNFLMTHEATKDPTNVPIQTCEQSKKDIELISSDDKMNVKNNHIIVEENTLVVAEKHKDKDEKLKTNKKQHLAYENPTFNLDNSLDSDEIDKQKEEEPLTIIVGPTTDETCYENNDLEEYHDQSSILKTYLDSYDFDWENSLRNMTNSFKDVSVSESTCKSSDSKKPDSIVNTWMRKNSFRYKRANNKKKLTKNEKTLNPISDNEALITTETSFDSMQGMEFFEGFGKKKSQQNHNNHEPSLPIDNSTQPLNIHLHALFSAVEHGHLDRARTILESTNVDLNRINGDGLSLLDFAVLSNNKSIVKILFAFGAQEGNQFKGPQSLRNHLATSLSHAENKIEKFGGNNSCARNKEIILEASNLKLKSFQRNNIAECDEDAEKENLSLWERRARILREMLLGFDQMNPPDMLFMTTIDVIGTKSVIVRFHDSDSVDSAICTKFKVQWCILDDFSIPAELEIFDMKKRECQIDGLVQGYKYYFRVAAGNMKGFSGYKNSIPSHVTPGSWRDVENKVPRFEGRLDKLNELFADLKRLEYNHDTPAVQRRNHKKKTSIKQLFTTISKFQKNLRRGAYLACVFYHNDKVLLTNEDFLPVIEIDETYPSFIYGDFYWLMKVACTWEDIKALRQKMEKSPNGSSNHFRIKLLQAAAQMQGALCTQDLGQLYYKTFRDSQGTLVFSIINQIKSSKSISINSKWTPLNKIVKKTSLQEDSNVSDILMASIPEQMTYHLVSKMKLSKGLYLGYLKMQSSVDLIQIFVPSKSPNILPHCKVRDNPHVSAEEWESLKRITINDTLVVNNQNTEEKENIAVEFQGTELQKRFVELLASTARRLFNYMDIGTDECLTHRLYDTEIIDLTPETTLLVIVPPSETACCVPGIKEIPPRNDLIPFPVQVFEMIHLNTYQTDIMNQYSRLSCSLELDTAQAQHNHREAFSSSELNTAKEKLAQLQNLQTQMNTVWKGARWLIDVIALARNRASASSQLSTTPQTNGISMKHLLIFDKNKNNGLKRSLFPTPSRDPKLVKSSPGRGSWPGPNGPKTPSNSLTTEFSKSEQQLPNNLNARRVNGVHRNAIYSSSTNSSIPENCDYLIPSRHHPSRSEETLFPTNYKHSPKNRSTIIVSESINTTSMYHSKSNLYNGSLSINSNKSLQPFASDECFGQNSTVNSRLSQVKGKPSKPTVSVASMKSGILEDQQVEGKTEPTLMSAPLPGILQVYTAYETGLAAGTSLKLHVTPRTTAREVVDLVINQLNMAVLLKGQEGPIYPAVELPNFCLVAVIGARERCLRDDFKPLQLQNPWKKGRLYVRQKQDVLAALEHSSKHTAYL